MISTEQAARLASGGLCLYGTAISRNLAQANGGSIKVESVAGKGSSFTVTMPIEESS